LLKIMKHLTHLLFLCQTEVNFLGQLRHPNLVKLIGYCCEDDHRLLVYEFMFRGSLENHLFRSNTSLCHDYLLLIYEFVFLWLLFSFLSIGIVFSIMLSTDDIIYDTIVFIQVSLVWSKLSTQQIVSHAFLTSAE
jgi:hypothetical protein